MREVRTVPVSDERLQAYEDVETEGIAHVRRAIASVIRGKPDVVDNALVCLLACGHLLIEDVPGVGKTTLAQALARSLDASFRRIQFTSDLLPSDILGVSVFDPERRGFEFKPGPIFANVVLADEINRATPKTQSAMLEAMNESQVSLDSVSYPLPRPFLVLATSNPIEYQGTFPLPESQLDRFLMRIRMGYPDEADEKRMLVEQQQDHPIDALVPVLAGEDVLHLQKRVRSVSVDDAIVDYLVRIVGETRRSNRFRLGVSPRGTLLLQRASQARALLDGRRYVVPDDVKALAVQVLAHRVVPTGTDDPSTLIEELLERTAAPL